MDLVLLATERRDLMLPTDKAWEVLRGVAPLEQHIRPWSPEEAEVQFVERYRILCPYNLRLPYA